MQSVVHGEKQRTHDGADMLRFLFKMRLVVMPHPTDHSAIQ
jgi:hypothetical protein